MWTKKEHNKFEDECILFTLNSPHIESGGNSKQIISNPRNIPKAKRHGVKEALLLHSPRLVEVCEAAALAAVLVAELGHADRLAVGLLDGEAQDVSAIRDYGHVFKFAYTHYFIYKRRPIRDGRQILEKYKRQA